MPSTPCLRRVSSRCFHCWRHNTQSSSGGLVALTVALTVLVLLGLRLLLTLVRRKEVFASLFAVEGDTETLVSGVRQARPRKKQEQLNLLLLLLLLALSLNLFLLGSLLNLASSF